tara:strand:- start:213 stop:371 length:159 start_codon:yes stop_codon:yes gene_type:complete
LLQVGQAVEVGQGTPQQVLVAVLLAHLEMEVQGQVPNQVLVLVMVVEKVEMI